MKGFFDTYEKRVQILVTGSARLDVYKRGGDSMMGRYFLYRLHPLSVRELVDPNLRESEIGKPLDSPDFDTLLQYGGFPEPFVQTKAPFAFQLSFERPFIDRDCFSIREPILVPARTFLSQLI